MKSIIIGQQELGMNLWDALVWLSVKKVLGKASFFWQCFSCIFVSNWLSLASWPAASCIPSNVYCTPLAFKVGENPQEGQQHQISFLLYQFYTQPTTPTPRLKSDIPILLCSGSLAECCSSRGKRCCGLRKHATLL